MSNLAVIEQTFKSADVTNRLSLALNLDPNDEKAKNEAYKYVSSALAEIAKTQGAEYGDLTKCTIDSLCRVVVDAAQFQIAIDGRKLAHIESRYDKNIKANVATLQIDTNGFVAKIKAQFPDAQFRTMPIFEGDTFNVKGTADVQDFDFVQKDPFPDFSKLRGIVAIISYTDGDKFYRSIKLVPKADLEKMRSKSKSHAWNDFTLERMETAALKRAAKWHFRQITVLQEMMAYDSRENFDMTQAASPVRSSIIDNINKELAPATVAGPEIPEAEIVEEAVPIGDNEPDYVGENMQLEGDKFAALGMAQYKNWWATLTDQQKESIGRAKHSEWQKIAQRADASPKEGAPF